MIFTEEYLFEATFTNPANLDRHYNQHVLKDGEEFNPDDPKFKPISKEEYARRAQELSETKAYPSDDRDPSHTVIGFVLKDGRCVKFRKRCSDYPTERYCEEVIYVDDENKGHEIISYLVGRPGKIFREKKNFLSELPENIPETEMNVQEALEYLNSIQD